MLSDVRNLLLAMLMRFGDQAVPDAHKTPAASQDHDLRRVKLRQELEDMAVFQAQRAHHDHEIQHVPRLFEEVRPEGSEQDQQFGQENVQDNHGNEEATLVDKMHQVVLVVVAHGPEALVGHQPGAAQIVVSMPTPQAPGGEDVCPAGGATTDGISDDVVAGRVVCFKEQLDDHAENVQHQ
mmetsp:Transcript_8167/g.16667  ORF Transcript_8167/g.16667 Transcript_8167/m.16667 type:complete len:181 (-) Transcript_8167:485-1027(-)